MERQKQIHDHKTIRPVLQQGPAKRMVRGGLYDFKKKNEEFKKRHQHQTNEQQKIHIHSNPNPKNKKRKFSDDWKKFHVQIKMYLIRLTIVK